MLKWHGDLFCLIYNSLRRPARTAITAISTTLARVRVIYCEPGLQGLEEAPQPGRQHNRQQKTPPPPNTIPGSESHKYTCSRFLLGQNRSSAMATTLRVGYVPGAFPLSVYLIYTLNSHTLLATEQNTFRLPSTLHKLMASSPTANSPSNLFRFLLAPATW